MRFVQYSTRFVIPAIYNTTEYFKMDPKIAKRYDRILTLTRKELSIARRTVRIFKQMQVLWTVYKLIKNFRKNREIPFKREGYVSYVILKSINNILASVFFSLDHVFWSYLIRLHRNKDLVGRVGDICDYVWIVQSCANMSLCLIEMGINQSHINKLNKKMKKINKEMKKSKKIENSEIENKKSELEKLAEKVRNLESTNSELPLEIVKSICDSIVNLNLLPLRLLFISSIVITSPIG